MFTFEISFWFTFVISIYIAYICKDYPVKDYHTLKIALIMDIKDRIKLLMEHEQMTSAAFAEQIGVAQATISHTLGDRNKYPSTDFIMKLHDRFNYISLDWLLTGKGNMIEGENHSTNVNTERNHSLFDNENAEITHKHSVSSENRKEMALGIPVSTSQNIVIQQVESKKTIEKKITEIRVFFDDNTYQIFKPEK